MDNKDLDIIKNSNERFAQKKREENLIDVPAEIAIRLEDALEMEDEGRYDKAAAICKEILDSEIGKDNEKVKLTLARMYPKLLEMDICDANKQYQNDVAEYFAFLDGLTMNDLIQEYVVETLAKLCELLDNEWFVPLFKEFVETVDKNGYLNREEYDRTVESAYCSYESVLYYNDARIPHIMKRILKSGFDKNFSLDGLKSEVSVNSMKLEIATNDYYLCKYYENNREELDYIKETYPHSYDLILPVLKEYAEEPEETLRLIIQKLMCFAAEGIDEDKLTLAMNRSYNDILISKPRPRKVSAGINPYHRPQRKVGRNDMCPCGSGKKYKNCCGKDL